MTRQLDADELWCVLEALDATVNMIGTTDDHVRLVMDMQEEALDLLAEVSPA